jgi:3-phosphoshikimate 1-carboxyvinyltransferase
VLEGDASLTLGVPRHGARAEGRTTASWSFTVSVCRIESETALDMGNSGTAMRLMAGILAGQAFDSELIGDESLSKRPMKRVSDPLGAMGATIATAEGGRPPLRIAGGRKLHGIDYKMPVASAQVKSCLLLAGLYAEGETSVTEPAPTRDHTERMLRGFGYAVKTQARASRAGSGRLGFDIDVPADISSATFFSLLYYAGFRHGARTCRD